MEKTETASIRADILKAFMFVSCGRNRPSTRQAKNMDGFLTKIEKILFACLMQANRWACTLECQGMSILTSRG